MHAATLAVLPISVSGVIDVWRPNCLCWTSEPLFHS
jgi:hypothetical protein